MKGLELPHEFELAVDGERVHVATIGGPEDFTELMRNITEAADAVGKRSSTTLPLTAGAHDISVGFLYAGSVSSARRATRRSSRSSQDMLDATGHPHIEHVDGHGPLQRDGPRATPPRARGIFTCRPADRRAATRSCRAQPTRSCAEDIHVRARSASVSRR